MERISVGVVKNFKATQNKELEQFVSILSNYPNIDCTDFIFHEDGKLKQIQSELSKEDVKKLFDKIIDNYYKKY